MKHKNKKPNRKLIEFIRFLMHWGVPILLFLFSFLISFLVPGLLYFNNNKFDIKMMSAAFSILIVISIIISTKLTKSWWNWLRNNNIIK